jgi:hypothetical protein
LLRAHRIRYQSPGDGDDFFRAALAISVYHSNDTHNETSAHRDKERSNNNGVTPMDVMDLLKNAPGLLESLTDAGVPKEKTSDLAGAIGQQLGGSDGLDLGDLLGGLNLEKFLSQVDVASVANQIGLSPAIVQKAVELIGPHVSEFLPSAGGLGALAGKFFK